MPKIMVSTRLDTRAFLPRTFILTFKAVACGQQSAAASRFHAFRLFVDTFACRWAFRQDPGGGWRGLFSGQMALQYYTFLV